MINRVALEKLEWPKLVDNLASYARTAEGHARCLSLLPDLMLDDVLKDWQNINDLKAIFSSGYELPIAELQDYTKILRSIRVGHILDGEELRLILSLLVCTHSLYSFCDSLKEKYNYLHKLKSKLAPLPKISEAIKAAISENGELLDDASPELAKIRKQKKSLRKRIEEKLKAIIHKSDLVPYLQDDYFTLRSDRYVIPMKLDSRGRVKGKIIDTSESGQTLFLEPSEISDFNEQLIDLELQEKLEILRIFRVLSQQAQENIDYLKMNYETIVDEDYIAAKARQAHVWHCIEPALSKTNAFKLVNARHPLISPEDGKVVGNDIETQESQTVLIISGPNAGGKTIVLKTVGLLHLMAKAGLQIPVDRGSEVFNFATLYLELGDSQDIAANLSTFSAHLMGLKPIINNASSNDMVLLDEIAVGTDPQTGSSIAQAIVEKLANEGVNTIVTTHYDSLKTLAMENNKFRNGSMEYSLENFKPTYKLIWDLPGQSFGIELAEQMGLPESIVNRARELRGTEFSSLDQAIGDYLREREKLQQSMAALDAEKSALESQKHHFENERKALQEERKKVNEKFSGIYREKLEQFEDEYYEQLDQMKKQIKELKHKGIDESHSVDLTSNKQAVKEKLETLSSSAYELEQLSNTVANLPGESTSLETLKTNDQVFVIPMQKSGTVSNIKDDGLIEVQLGVLKINVAIHDLRLMNGDNTPQARIPKKQRKSPSHKKPDIMEKSIIKTSTNTLDSRGLKADQAIELAFGFIDKALLRGENYIIILHGHGTGSLKTAIRQALNTSCPYNVVFRPGFPDEGGDGVTVVAFNI